MSLLTGGVTAQTQATVLHSFTGGNDGENPDAGLTNVDGVLYGTTNLGGSNGQGTVFKITPSGTESVIHDFKTHGGDGAYPGGGLTDLNGVLYGTTLAGGTTGKGTVFKITTSGTLEIVHSFVGGNDGAGPSGGLTNVDGVLYGTTAGGGGVNCGGGGCGTVFSISPPRSESVLHSFAGGSDGASPNGNLTSLNGVLYGTTLGNDAKGDYGTVFSITTSGTERVLHNFGGANDGLLPTAGLAGINGVLYGTTSIGGATGRNLGTVFKITTSGAEKVIHSFANGNDGALPESDLANINGVLYGTTYQGGAKSNAGTVFKITTSGEKAGLLNFVFSDGAHPGGRLANVNGALYGTTSEGGAGKAGVVYSLPL